MSNLKRSASAATRTHNRVAAIMSHISWYSFRGISRLAKDTGLNKSTLCKLVSGRTNPLYVTVERVVKCLEFRLGFPLDMREVVEEDGEYPTEHVCKLVGCRNCLPDAVHEDDGSRKPAYIHVKTGQWTGDTCEFDSDLEEMTE